MGHRDQQQKSFRITSGSQKLQNVCWLWHIKQGLTWIWDVSDKKKPAPKKHSRRKAESKGRGCAGRTCFRRALSQSLWEEQGEIPLSPPLLATLLAVTWPEIRLAWGSHITLWKSFSSWITSPPFDTCNLSIVGIWMWKGGLDEHNLNFFLWTLAMMTSISQHKHLSAEWRSLLALQPL